MTNNEEKIKDLDVNNFTFRVMCLHSTPDGSIKLQSEQKICGYGHGFTIKEMNENLIQKGKPFIKIGYCKYCYNEDCIGVFDDVVTKEMDLGFNVIEPDENNPEFRIVKSDKEIDILINWIKKIKNSLGKIGNAREIHYKIIGKEKLPSGEVYQNTEEHFTILKRAYKYAGFKGVI